MLLFRFLISPALWLFALVYLVPLPGLARTVFVLQAGMPAMTQTALVAGRYGADEGYAAGLCPVLTTMGKPVQRPLYPWFWGVQVGYRRYALMTEWEILDGAVAAILASPPCSGNDPRRP